MIAKKEINIRQHVTVDTQKDNDLSVLIRQNKRIVTITICRYQSDKIIKGSRHS